MESTGRMEYLGVKEENIMTKSTVKKAAAAKAETKAPVAVKEAPVVEAKETVAAPEAQTAAAEAPAKKKPGRKPAAAKTEAPAAEKKPAAKRTAAAKKAAVKEEAPAEKKAPAKRAAKKAEVKAVVSVQFAGKDYSTERLVEIAKDVWQYDLGQKAEDFKTAELYVKPEESAVYYVINGEVSGKFEI